MFPGVIGEIINGLNLFKCSVKTISLICGEYCGRNNADINVLNNREEQ